jgi:hypothetical protein
VNRNYYFKISHISSEKNQFLNAKGLYMWAEALHQLGKVDVALKKVETALTIEVSCK